MRKFNPVSVSSKYGICGLPIRVDSYRKCTFHCQYCFSNYRVVAGSDDFAVGNVNSVKNILKRIFDKNEVREGNFLDTLIKDRITWHFGGMSDPFQHIEEEIGITKEIVDVTNKYDIDILFSTKSNTVYDVDVRPDLHTFQLSVTNLHDNDIEPNVPSIESRIKFFKQLKNKGFKVGIRVQPFIPGITEAEIVDVFREADYFTIEGLKLVPQNMEHRELMYETTGIPKESFKQMGLLNLKPETRIEAYKDIIERLEKYGIPYSIADNDMHDISSGKCCCGDPLVKKSTNFNNTALIQKYGVDYDLEDVLEETGKYGSCIAKQLFTSNRQEGCETVDEFYKQRINRSTSPMSPKFLYINKK